MESWIFREPERLRREREEYENLKSSADWLIVADWKIERDGLCVDAVIRVHGYDYEVRLSYPDLFPHTPPIVRPRNAEGRWSGHQYGGENGVLCLEYRPDNWHSEITGSQMLESAHRLLDMENPLGENRPERPVTAPSAHLLTTGQEARGKWARWYSSESLGNFFAEQNVSSAGSFRFSLRDPNGNWIILIHEAAPLGGDAWKDEQIPACIPDAVESHQWIGIWLNAPEHDPATIKAVTTLEAVRIIAREAGHPPELLATDGSSPVIGFDRGTRAVLIRDRQCNLHLFINFLKPGVIRCTPVCSETNGEQMRLPEGPSLAGKSIGIVGLGSAGSKIAMTLARTGARKFYLVDHDLFLPENLVRNALDWQAVGEHKVDATATALRLVAPDVLVTVSRTHLTGQESNACASVVLDRLGNCDLVIDATANPRVFNLLAAVSEASGKPLLWLEIFAGGIGGLIARSRPGMDPSPQTMRAVYLAYCEEHPFPSQQPAHDYTLEDAEGRVLAASDADVSIIAHHAARLAADTVLVAADSNYPYSMYLIGLEKSWIFEAPFSTVPLATESFMNNETREIDLETFGSDNLAFINQLLKKRDHATPPSP